MHGRLGLIPLEACHIFWIPTAYRMDQATFEAGNYANLALAAFAIIGFSIKRMCGQWIVAVAFGIVVVWASVFVWTGGSLQRRPWDAAHTSPQLPQPKYSG